jgi:3-keto-5-aminohexanoate cleavage enzyme
MNAIAKREIPYSWRYTDTYEFLERVQHGMPPAIICVACNGGVQGKESHPALPETADEIADSVYEAYCAGASVVHVHARDPRNLPEAAITTEVWREVNSKIRARCPDIIINNTTGGGPNSTMQNRLACLDARPELASLNLTPDMSRFKLKERRPPLPNPRGPTEFDDCIPFTYRLVEAFARAMKERGIKPELETYHSGGAWVIRDLIETGLIESPIYVQTVMGYQTSSFPTPENVLQLVKEFPPGAIWLCSGIGPFQLPMTTFALLLGGHARVGLEDNLYLKRGQKLKSNAEVVARTVRIAHELNRQVATPVQARRMLGISATPSSY